MDQNYAILGIHGRDVETVNVYEDVKGADGIIRRELKEERNVARVRLFIGKNRKPVDEDFDLPSDLPPGLAPTTEAYEWFLRPAIKQRVAELEKTK